MPSTASLPLSSESYSNNKTHLNHKHQPTLPTTPKLYFRTVPFLCVADTSSRACIRKLRVFCPGFDHGHSLRSIPAVCAFFQKFPPHDDLANLAIQPRAVALDLRLVVTILRARPEQAGPTPLELFFQRLTGKGKMPSSCGFFSFASSVLLDSSAPEPPHS